VPSWLNAVDQLETEGASEDRLTDCLGEVLWGKWNALPVGVAMLGDELGNMESACRV